MSVPTDSELAGILMVAAPLERAVALEVYPPPDRVTDPVAVVVLPDTLTATDNASAEEMAFLAGETVTLGVVFWVPPPPPPQPANVKPAATITSSTLSILRLRRDPSGTNRSSSPAMAVPPAAVNQFPPRWSAAFTRLATVVETVTVPVCAVALVIATLLPVSVGALTAPAGDDVTAAVSVTVPVYPPAGVTVTVEVLALEAPAVNVTSVAERVNVLAVTLIPAVFVPGLYVVSPL